MTHDNSVQPNYIPEQEKQHNKYIEENDSIESMLQQNKNNKKQDRLDMLYEELQIPVLSMILYFLFSIAFFNKFLVKHIPSLFLKDGNSNLYGYLFKTFVFGVSFYSITKFSKYMSEF